MGIAAVLALVGAAAGCGWDEPTGCAYWVGKLERGEEVQIAMQRVAAAGCAEARPLLAARLADPALGGDALAALVALGRSPEAEAAVRGALADPRRAEDAARQVEAWGLEAALPELREALASEVLARHREALLRAALAVAPPEALVDALLAVATADGAEGAARAAALEALGRVDWAEAAAQVPEAARWLALAALRPDGGDAALAALARLPAEAVAAPDGLGARAREGDRRALVLLAALDAAAGRAAAAAALAGPDEAAWPVAAPLAVGGDAAALEAAIARDEQDADRVWQAALALGPPAAALLAREAAEARGDRRAAAVRAQALVLDGPALDAWAAAVAAHPSALVREALARADVKAAMALTRACGADAACLARQVAERAPALATVEARLAEARAALQAARTRAEAAVAEDRERAQALAGVAEGEGAAAARKELDALRARRDEAWKAVEAAAAAVDGLEGELAGVTLALRRLAEPAAGEAGPAVAAAIAVLAAATGPATSTLRLWAYSTLRQRARPADAPALRQAGAALDADPALALALERLAARLAPGGAGEGRPVTAP